MDPRSVIIRPVISEKTYALIAAGKYTFRVKVRTSKVRSKPKRRGLHSGRSRSWKKAVVELAPGETIDLFEGAAVEG